MQSDEHLAERVEARMQRQERLAERDRPGLRVVLDEAVLRRPVGGAAVMRRQLRRLLAAARARRTTIQVLPFQQGQHDSLGGSMTLLTMPDGTEAAYLEGSDYGQLVEEPTNVKEHALIYDRLRAAALPPVMSLDMTGERWRANTVERTSRLELTGADWRKSSYSNQEGGNCVEVADGFPGVVPVRDSKMPHGPALLLPSAAWSAFVSEL